MIENGKITYIFGGTVPYLEQIGLPPRSPCLGRMSLHRAGGFWDLGQQHVRWRFAVSVPRSTVLPAHQPEFRISVKKQFVIRNYSFKSTSKKCTNLYV